MPISLNTDSAAGLAFNISLIIISFVILPLLSALSPKNIFISSSTDDIPPMPKFSTRTFVTFGDKNAGRVGPK